MKVNLQIYLNQLGYLSSFSTTVRTIFQTIKKFKRSQFDIFKYLFHFLKGVCHKTINNDNNV